MYLENITMQDDYEGDFETTKKSSSLYLRFTAKDILFGPVFRLLPRILSEKATVTYLAGDSSRAVERDVTVFCYSKST